MKKYKLIKEYPGSPNLGFTVSNNTDSGKYWFKDISNMSTILYSDKFIQDYPEFWEEIIDKDYEILSIISSRTGIIYKKDSQLKDVFCYIDGKRPFYTIKSIDNILFLIYSIKRLSDNEIFTIGDKITVKGNKKLGIISIDILRDWSDGYFGDADIALENFIKVIEKPLFTTTDGVDIFKGDKYYNLDYYYNLKLIKNASMIKPSFDISKYFSTKEKAEEYIIYNKSVLSLNDLIKLDVSKDGEVYIDEVEKLIKQKLDL